MSESDPSPEDASHPGQDDDIAAEFRRLVNMRPAQLRHWLDSEESQSVGWTQEGEQEAVGHQSGRRLLDLLQQEHEPEEADLAFMRKVVGYIHRHLAQRPAHDISESRWRYSLMNWGHDPLK